MHAAAEASKRNHEKYPDYDAYSAAVLRFGDAAFKCQDRTGSRGPDLVSIYIRLSADAEIEQVLVEPRTRFTRCVASETKRVRFPAPPEPSYWIEFTISSRPPDDHPLRDSK